MERITKRIIPGGRDALMRFATSGPKTRIPDRITRINRITRISRITRIIIC